MVRARTMLKGVALAVALASWPGAIDAARAAGVELLPHHAVYKLSLASANGSKAPADASGMISYDFSGSPCDGFKTAFRQVTALQPAEGDARVSATETTTLESGDAAKFDFDIHTSVNQGDPDSIKGEATRGSDDALAIALDAPEPASLALKTPALFPTQHLSRIIAAAESGTRIVSAPVFDGSDTGKKVFSTLSVIGAAVTDPAPEPAAQDAALRGRRRWPVTISYFEPGGSDAQPVYVLSFQLYDNGVSRALKVDYGTFALAGELVEFKPGAPSACAR